MIKNYTEYKSPQYRLGVDDLKSHYAFSYGATGESLDSNIVEEYENSKGWLGINSSFKDVDCTNQEEIYKKSISILLDNLSRIRKLTESGDYGKLVDGPTIRIEHDPLYDDLIKSKINFKKDSTSYRFEVLDFRFK